MISDLGGFTPPTFVGQHHVCWITIPMFSAEFYGCICIHRCCCEAMCFPWQTYQFLLVKQKLTHFPNFSWYKLFKTLKNIWFSDFPMIFPWFSHFSHDFPMIFPGFSWWKPTIPRCPQIRRGRWLQRRGSGSADGRPPGPAAGDAAAGGHGGSECWSHWRLGLDIYPTYIYI